MNAPQSKDELNAWLVNLAESVKLREGVEGVYRALWSLHQNPGISTHDWSWHVQIPVPVMAALRRELEKRDVLQQVRTLKTTPQGEDILKRLFGRPKEVSLVCPACDGRGNVLPPQAMPLVERFVDICDERPDPDVSLDQSHATPETGILKALFLLNKGLLGRSLFFMGDDDLISIACYLVREAVYDSHEPLGRIVVADIDNAYLELIQKHSDKRIETFIYDARESLPIELQSCFDVGITDPPYTPNGIQAFAGRCRQSVGDSGRLLLSFPPPGGADYADIQRKLLDIGWRLDEIHPQFNEYEGASMHAHHSTLFVCETFQPLSPDIDSNLRYTSFYTGERKAPGGRYECTMCETRYDVGPGREWKTIDELKQSTCEECGNDRFKRVGSLDS